MRRPMRRVRRPTTGPPRDGPVTGRRDRDGPAGAPYDAPMAVRSTSVRTIDLNADAGEGDDERPMGDDAALVPLVSSVNVACGGHAGDRTTMAQIGRAHV